MIEDIKTYLKDRFFRPKFVEERPLKQREHWQGVFREKGRMSSEARTQFFNEAYGDILFEVFLSWTQSDLDERELREDLYKQVLAISQVRNKLAEYETYANNLPFIGEEEEQDEDEEAHE